MKMNWQQKLIDLQGAKIIIEKLADFVSEPRKQRIENVISGKLNSIQLAIESPSDLNNALATVRTSEALGISQVHIITPEADARGIRGITQGAFYWLTLSFYQNFNEFIQGIRDQDFLLAGGLPTAHRYLEDVPVDKKICLLMGNEQRGLSAAALAECDIHYKIPMFGMSESLNLSVSAAISLYDLTTRKRHQSGKLSDLTAEEILNTRAHFYLNSVDRRLVIALTRFD
jgi:tRNA (guanosine-2'-O-)-methyltransferase